MATSLTTRITAGTSAVIKGSSLSSTEIDNNFISLAENKMERSNNLSDLTDSTVARDNLGVPSLDGDNAFGTWSIGISGNASTATTLSSSPRINGVIFDGSQNITITAPTPEKLVAGDGLLANQDFDGNFATTIEIDPSTVVLRSGDQTIDGAKTFNTALVLGQQAFNDTQAVRADRNISGGDGLSGGGDLSSDVSLSVDNTVVRTSGNQSIQGQKTFLEAISLSTQASAIDHAVRADRDINAGSGLTGGGDLTNDRTISHANTSSQASVSNSGNRLIQSITLDTFGHVTGLTSRTVDIDPMPVGTTYVQFPGRAAPGSLFSGTWSAIFDNEGIFFRTPGGNARSFGSGIQEFSTENLFATRDNIGSQDYYIREISTPGWTATEFLRDTRGDGSSGSSSTRRTGLDVRSMNTGETRPRNRTVRVWVRTA